MPKVYTSAIVIIPPEDKWNQIQEIRKQYDRQINRWMPHITLLYPFLPKSIFTAFEKQFSSLCKEIPAFEIILSSFKSFNHGHQKFTIWLEPEPKSLIIDLQSKLLKIVPECNDVNLYKGGFTPHLSVGQIKGRKKLKDAIKTLQNSWKELKFTLSSIYLISREQDKSAKFHIQKQILFYF